MVTGRLCYSPGSLALAGSSCQRTYCICRASARQEEIAVRPVFRKRSFPNFFYQNERSEYTLSLFKGWI